MTKLWHFLPFFKYTGSIVFALVIYTVVVNRKQCEVVLKEETSADGKTRLSTTSAAHPEDSFFQDESRSRPRTKAGSNRKIAQPKADRRRNVLFLIVDDLRPQLGAYRDPKWPDYFSRLAIRTPNLDKLASESVVFTHAYAQYSLCGPSRTSLLTSRRPDTTRVYSNTEYWRDVGGNFTTLPQHFKDNGYRTIGLGKVFHPELSSNYDDPPSWTDPYYNPPYTDLYYMSKGTAASWKIVTEEETAALPLMDDNIAEEAKSILAEISEEAKSGERRFFLAVGFNKPHVHMICPERYYNLYPLEDEHDFMPNRSWQEPIIRPYGNFEGVVTRNDERVMPADVLRGFRRAYFACISYVDDLVGDVLRQLDELGLGDETVVSFMADHGFHLGENRAFAKFTTWEMANRVPMMIRIPGVTNSGVTVPSVVESVDIFPTLVEAAGLDPIPPCPRKSYDVPLCTHGTSLMPLIQSPDAAHKQAAYSQILTQFGNKYTMRTDHFRLVDLAFIKSRKQANGRPVRVALWSPDTNRTELYDHRTDALEERNLVNHPDYRDTVIELRRQLHKFVANQL